MFLQNQTLLHPSLNLTHGGGQFFFLSIQTEDLRWRFFCLNLNFLQVGKGCIEQGFESRIIKTAVGQRMCQYQADYQLKCFKLVASSQLRWSTQSTQTEIEHSLKVILYLSLLYKSRWAQVKLVDFPQMCGFDPRGQQSTSMLTFWKIKLRRAPCGERQRILRAVNMLYVDETISSEWSFTVR